jgi:alpha-L-fucosidase
MKMKKYIDHKWLVLTCLIMGVFFLGSAQNTNNPNAMNEMWGDEKVSVDALKAGRGKLFDESNFGMFIHWGLFSHLGGKWQGKTYYGIGEWIMNGNMANIPAAEYQKVAKEFNPAKFDAKAIARLAKDAGMKYIIITSKHHEGFAMFHSKADPFNIVEATPFARDPMKELSAACRELGLGFGFYYSHNQDWTAPGGSRGPNVHPDGTPATFEDYFYRKCLPQVKEICTQYGPIDFVWFDTPGDMKKELVVELVKVVRELQPNAMLCSRVGHGMGDYASKGDMEVPPVNIPGLWETCDTNNDSWSYAWYDNNFKSPKEILNRLVATVARGGTYLFNVGPDGQGQIPGIGAQFLRETGAWIQKYPQVVYAAGPSPWGHALPWGDVTTRGNSIFLSVFEWPHDGKLYLPGLKKDILSARLLQGTNSKKISFDKKQDWTIFQVPCQPGDSPASVIELTFKEALKTSGYRYNAWFVAQYRHPAACGICRCERSRKQGNQVDGKIRGMEACDPDQQMDGRQFCKLDPGCSRTGILLCRSPLQRQRAISLEYIHQRGSNDSKPAGCNREIQRLPHGYPAIQKIRETYCDS